MSSVNVLKFLSLFSFYWLSGLEFHKMLVRKANRKYPNLKVQNIYHNFLIYQPKHNLCCRYSNESSGYDCSLEYENVQMFFMVKDIMKSLRVIREK